MGLPLLKMQAQLDNEEITSFYNANLEGTRLKGNFNHTNFSYANLEKARLNEAFFSYANFDGTEISESYRFPNDIGSLLCTNFTKNTVLNNYQKEIVRIAIVRNEDLCGEKNIVYLTK